MTKAPTISQFRRSFGTHLSVNGRWQGDAYGYHPHGVICRPMVYTDHHHISRHCDAKVMTDPTARMKPLASGRDASLHGSSSNCVPTPETGELVTVWRNGDWVGPDGPWRQAMRRDMARVLRNIRDIRRAEYQAAACRRAEHEDRQRVSYVAAANAFA